MCPSKPPRGRATNHHGPCSLCLCCIANAQVQACPLRVWASSLGRAHLNLSMYPFSVLALPLPTAAFGKLVDDGDVEMPRADCLGGGSETGRVRTRRLRPCLLPVITVSVYPPHARCDTAVLGDGLDGHRGLAVHWQDYCGTTTYGRDY